jgi:hypothetical protein
LNPEYLQQIRMAAQRSGDSCGWTGTSGTLARYVMELLKDREQRECCESGAAQAGKPHA